MHIANLAKQYRKIRDSCCLGENVPLLVVSQSRVNNLEVGVGTRHFLDQQSATEQL
jgi:hypothetical protein